VNRLFILCPFVKLVWRVLHATFGISPPINITNLFENWLNSIDAKTKAKIHIGVLALVWAVRNCQNNIVFNRNDFTNLLQYIFCQATLWHINRLQDVLGLDNRQKKIRWLIFASILSDS
jgi:hypothetical protein